MGERGEIAPRLFCEPLQRRFGIRQRPQRHMDVDAARGGAFHDIAHAYRTAQCTKGKTKGLSGACSSNHSAVAVGSRRAPTRSVAVFSPWGLSERRDTAAQ